MHPRDGEQNPWQRPEPPPSEQQQPAEPEQTNSAGAHPGQPPSMFQPPPQYAQYGQSSPYGQSDSGQGGPPQYQPPQYQPPQYGQPQYDQPPAPQYGQPARPAYGQSPYGQPSYGSPPAQPQQYGSPQYGSPQYGSPQYGSQYGSPQYGSQQYGSQQYGQSSPPYGMYQPSPAPHRRVNKKLIGIVAALVAVVIVVGGIAYAVTQLGSHKLSHSAVEKTIESQSTDTSKSFRTVTAVSCNDGKDVAVKKDASFTCTAAGNLRITVVIKSAASNPDWVWAID